MLKHKEVFLIGALMSLGAWMGGCAGSVKTVSSEVPNQSMSGESPTTQRGSLKASDHYVVKPHDCLWTIAGKPNVYGDPFEWPLLFKANRDLIQDPDLIYTNQKLKVEKGLTQAQIDKAKQLADSTPQYKPHPKRKEKQLVEYF